MRAPAPQAAPRVAEPPGFGEIDLDLPVIAAALPVTSTRGDRDLPAPLADLPAVLQDVADLPLVAAALPDPVAALPVVGAHLPVPAAPRPSPSPSRAPPTPRAFGEIDLPTPEEPPVPAHNADFGASPARSVRSLEESGLPTASFGEIELPRGSAGGQARPASDPAPMGSKEAPGEFADLELEERPVRSRGRISAAPPRSDPGLRSGGGGMTFGEVELSTAEGRIAPLEAATAVEAVAAPASPGMGAPPSPMEPAATAPVRSAPAATPREGGGRRRFRGRSAIQWVASSVLAASVLGGAALQLTPYGAFGYLRVQDVVYAGAYAQATTAAIAGAERALATDTYDGATRALDLVLAAHARTPRAKSLTAYAALVDAATSVRFGADTGRASRAKALLAELPGDEPARYRDVALAAQAARNGEWDRARPDLESALKAYAGDPADEDIALLLGEVALASGDASAALAAYTHALGRSDDARAHFGLARSHYASGETEAARREVEATLALSPDHPGALTLRARLVGSDDEARALQDLARVLEGPARSKASPADLSRAYAGRAWLLLERGSASDAKDAFARAVALDPRNVVALRGEGRLFLTEGRYAEALARFDAALGVEPSSADVVADDAEAKMALDRLADAKQQLLDARRRFPRSIAVLLSLGRVEQRLGDVSTAEADLRAAVAMAEPSRRDAVAPYVALSELLSARGRLSDAKATLDDATRRLVPSAALDRALGDVSELQGDHENAIEHYRAAIARDPHDVASHFRLAVTMRRLRRFDQAVAELDRVAAVDRDYPGLSLERGLLFEESGDVEKAIEEFKGALAKAPNDPDLQLRVGSAYVSIGRPDDAIPMLHKVLEARPSSAEAHHYLGRALMLKGPAQQADALRYLKRAVDLDPNRAEFHVYLAWAANEATPAQLELARDEIDRALALDKLNPEAYWQKGVLERMEGAIEDAIRDEKRALELRPSRYEAHATLAECYEDKNDEAGALAEWAKAMAGDGPVLRPDGSVPHPYWRYKYGKLLLDRGQVVAALPLLSVAADALERTEQRPGWLAPLEFATAAALRKNEHKREAVDHYRRFLEIAPATSPDRAEAESDLRQLTGER